MTEPRDPSFERTPARPPAPTETQSGSWLTIWLAFGVFVAVCVALSFLSLGTFAPVIVLGLAIVGFAMLHYLAWGWWLSGFIRRQVEEEDRDDAAKPGSPD